MPLMSLPRPPDCPTRAEALPGAGLPDPWRRVTNARLPEADGPADLPGQDPQEALLLGHDLCLPLEPEQDLPTAFPPPHRVPLEFDLHDVDDPPLPHF